MLEQELTRYIPIVILPLVAVIIVLRKVCRSLGQWRSGCVVQAAPEVTVVDSTRRQSQTPAVAVAPWLVPPALVDQDPDLWSAGWDPMQVVGLSDHIDHRTVRVRPCLGLDESLGSTKGEQE